MNYNKGDILLFGENKTRLSYVGISLHRGLPIAEHLGEYNGWDRDNDVPKDYISIGINRYWYIKPGETWELETKNKHEYEIY